MRIDWLYGIYNRLYILLFVNYVPHIIYMFISKRYTKPMIMDHGSWINDLSWRAGCQLPLHHLKRVFSAYWQKILSHKSSANYSTSLCPGFYFTKWK
jgi:hypothetical protein